MDVFLQQKYKKQFEEEERSKLFGQRKSGAQGSALGNLMKENDLLKDSNYVVDELTESGNSIIYALVGQNARLKTMVAHMNHIVHWAESATRSIKFGIAGWPATTVTVGRF
eukprot:gene15370-18231_t